MQISIRFSTSWVAMLSNQSTKEIMEQSTFRKMKWLGFVLVALLFVLPTTARSQCNVNTSICVSGTAGPFSFVAKGPAVSTCLDWSGPNVAYIMLNISTSGPLNMLIQGNTSSGFLDVAVFNVPTGVAPCTAIQNTANQLGCNYAAAAGGCNQFGTFYGCSSSVPAPNVVAGQNIMIVVENWSGLQVGSPTSFTLSLAPTGAQAGLPNATITPSGPVCNNTPAYQLVAADAGGVWSGPGTSSTGIFTPASAGVGTHTINYTVGVSPCIASSSTTITVYAAPATPFIPPQNRCGAGSVTLSGSPGSLGLTFRWYSAASGGPLLLTGTSYTAVYTATTTVYVSQYNPTTGCESARVPVVVTVNSLSTQPSSIAGTTTICAGGTTTLTQVGGALGTGASYQWFSGGCASTSVGTGNSIIVAPTTTTTYFVRAAGTCNTTNCASITVVVDQFTTANAGPNQTVCGSSATLAGNLPTTGTGVWTVVGGSGTITTPSNPSTTVTGLGLGNTTLRWTLLNGVCPDSQDDVVISRDNIPPSIACPPNQNVAGSPCLAVVTYSAPNASDNCAIASVTSSPASGSVFALGTTTVVGVATDVNGNATSCSFTVTVRDVTPPFISCPANIVVNASPGLCTGVATFAAPSGSDACSGTTVSQLGGLGSGATYSPGITTNTFRATDAAGNSATCSFTVTVVDNQTPTINCPANINVNAASGLCAAAVSYASPTIADNCPGATLSLVAGAPSGASFPVGVTNNTYRVTAANGATSTCSFSVTVVDNQAPTITCPPNQNVVGSPCNAIVTYTTPNASDNCAIASVTSSPASGSVFALGTTTVVGVATDVYGNATSCSFTVTVSDVTPPFISCPANISVNASPGLCTGVATFAAPSGSDACSGTTISQLGGLGSGATYGPGITTNTFRATDAAGNSATCSFTVTVVDNQAPTITCPANISVNAAPGLCAANVTYSAPNGTDNCPGATTTQISGGASGTSFPVGVTTNAFRVTAANGATSTCSFTVSVIDNQLPTITCPANISVNAASGLCAANVTFTAPNGTDNCPGATTTQIAGIGSGGSFPVGVTTNTFRITAANGATATCSFSVTVVDNQLPTIACPANISVNNVPGLCAANVTYSAPNGADNCAGATTTQIAGGASGTSFPVGVTTNSFRVTAANGATATCSFTVTVVDAQLPTITCPANVTVSNDPGICGAMVNYATPSGSDNCTGQTTVRTAGLATGATFPLGTTTNTYVVTATNGQTATCSFTVTVNSAEINVTGNAVAIVDGDLTPSLTDHTDFGTPFPGVPVTRTYTIQNSGSIPLTVNTITMGGANAANFTVGGITLPATVAPSGSTTFTVTFLASPLGVYNATVLINNSDCNESPFDFAIRGEVSCQPPAFSSCPANISVNAALNLCTQVVTYAPVVTGAPTPTLAYTLTGATTGSGSGTGSGSAFNGGVTTVTITATNPCGAATCVFTVTVIDTQSPVLSGVPANATVSCDNIPAPANVTATDNCPGLGAVDFTQVVGGAPLNGLLTQWLFNEGAGTTTADASGNGNTGTLSPGVSWTPGMNGTAVTFPGTGNDYVEFPNGTGGPLDAPNSISLFARYWPGTNGSVQMPIIQYNPGGWGVHLWQTGPNQLFVRFTVRGSLAFTTALAANVLVPNTWNCVGATYDYNSGMANLWHNGVNVASLNIGQIQLATNHPLRIGSVDFDGRRTNGKVENALIYDRALNSTEVGNLCDNGSCPQNYQITRNWTVTDGSGNTASAGQTITVQDVTPPVVTCPANVSVNTTLNQCGAAVSFQATATDNCANVVTVTQAPASGSFFSVGTTNVAVTAADQCGNTSTCSFTVTVNDVQAPNAICQPVTVQLNSAGNGSTSASAVNNGSNDACGIASMTLNNSSFTCANVGANTVILTVTDVNGNSSTCSAAVTVQDNIAPIALCQPYSQLEQRRQRQHRSLGSQQRQQRRLRNRHHHAEQQQLYLRQRCGSQHGDPHRDRRPTATAAPAR